MGLGGDLSTLFKVLRIHRFFKLLVGYLLGEKKRRVCERGNKLEVSSELREKESESFLRVGKKLIKNV